MSNRHKVFTIAVIFIVILLLFFRVWITSSAVQIACEINLLDQKKENLEEENKRLMIELATLKSPERISRVATYDLSMIRSSESKIIFLER